MATNSRRFVYLLVGLPVLIVVGWSGIISLVNWEYEAKFFQPAVIHGQPDYYLGPKLFAIGIASSVASSLFIFLAFWHASRQSSLKWIYVSLTSLIALFLLIMALAVAVLGPAAITMKEQLVKDR